MATHLIRELEQFTRLSSSDKQALEQAAAQKVRRLSPRDDVREGDRPLHINLILEGWACRIET